MSATGYDSVRKSLDASKEQPSRGAAAIPMPPGAVGAMVERSKGEILPPTAETEDDIQLTGTVLPTEAAAEPKTSAPSAARRLAPKVSAEMYSGWKDRVDDNEYAYARSPNGDEFVILRAPADKQHLVGVKLSPDIVEGSPRLQRSYAAIKAKVEENLPAAKAWEGAAVETQPSQPDPVVADTTASSQPDPVVADAAASSDGDTRKSKPKGFARVKDILNRSNRSNL